MLLSIIVFLPHSTLSKKMGVFAGYSWCTTTLALSRTVYTRYTCVSKINTQFASAPSWSAGQVNLMHIHHHLFTWFNTEYQRSSQSHSTFLPAPRGGETSGSQSNLAYRQGVYTESRGWGQGLLIRGILWHLSKMTAHRHWILTWNKRLVHTYDASISISTRKSTCEQGRCKHKHKHKPSTSTS